MDKIFKIELLPIAEQDLYDIIDYIMLDNPEAALKMADKFDESFSNLERYPNSGSEPEDLRLKALKYRFAVVDPYLIFYVFSNDTVEIRRILHGKRKYSFLL